MIESWSHANEPATRRDPIVPAVLTQHSYGKSRIRLTKVTRLADRHEVRELTIEIELEGDFAASYTSGDNRLVIADGHDEERRLRAGPGASAGIDRGLRRGAGQPLPRPITPTSSRRPSGSPSSRWSGSRRRAASIPTPSSAGRSETRTSTVDATRDAACASSRAWTTCSCSKRPTRPSAGFLRDRYTTLPRRHRSDLRHELKADWLYAADGRRSTGTRRIASVRRALLETFAGHQSLSVQQTLHAMGDGGARGVPRDRARSP